MAKKALKFDPDKHVYTYDGRKVISNTDFLTAMGFCDYSGMPPDRRKSALEIGTDVHMATAILDSRMKKGWREEYSHVEGYVAAWKKFKKDFKFRPILIEEPLYDEQYDVATTPDRHGNSIHGHITVQIKTGKVQDWVGLQLAFEERCILRAQGITSPSLIRLSSSNRFAMELHADGTYKPYRFQDPNDISVYLGALGYFRWMERKVPQLINFSNQEVL